MQNEITLRDLLRQLRFVLKVVFKKKLIILFICFIGSFLGALYAYKSTPKYQAKLVFIVQDGDRGSNSSLLSLASQVGLNFGTSNNVFATRNIAGLLNSNQLITATLLTPVTVNNERKSLLNFYLDITGRTKKLNNNPKAQKLSFPLSQARETFSRAQDSVLYVISNEIRSGVVEILKVDDNADFFTLFCKSKDENFSYLFANELIKQLVSLYNLTKTQRALQIVDILQGRADSVRRSYDAALHSRAATIDQNINPAFQAPLVTLQQKQTDITVLTTEYGEIIKNLELAKFNLLKETPLVQIIDEPQMPLKRLKPSFIVYGFSLGVLFGLISIVYFVNKARKKKLVSIS